jgi:hypothetical protein
LAAGLGIEGTDEQPENRGRPVFGFGENGVLVRFRRFGKLVAGGFCYFLLLTKMKIEAVFADKVFKFLLELEAVTKSGGDSVAHKKILSAKAFYIIPITSEFLGESMQAMNVVLERDARALSLEQRNLAAAYISEIKKQWFS